MQLRTNLGFVSLLGAFARAAAHGYISFPPMRGGTRGSSLTAYCPQCGNGESSVCGDGGQWGADSDLIGHLSGPQTVLTAGSVVEFVIEVTAHHKGHFEFGLCSQQVSRSTAGAQACFDGRKLQRAPPPGDCVPDDSRGDCQPVQAGHPERWYLPPGTGTYTMRFQIPSDFECPLCTLQWRWWTANSCIPAEDYGCFFDALTAAGWDAASWCGEYCGSCSPGLLQANSSRVREHQASASAGCGEEFRNCADVVVSGSGAPAPAPVTSPAPTPAPAPQVVAPTPAPAPTPMPAAVPTPEPSPATSSSFCEGKKGLFAAPPGAPGNVDCRGFYNCWHGQEPMQLCSSGQRFNEQLKYCDWAASVQCAAPEPEPEPEPEGAALAQRAKPGRNSRHRGFLGAALIQNEAAVERTGPMAEPNEEL